MVEGPISPTGGGVALIAGLRKARLHMVRIRRPLEIFQVAVHAGAAIQAVVVVDVALRALQRGVRSGQRKSRRRMVECRAGPVGRRMTGLAGGGKPCRRVRRIIRSVEIVLMAADAGGIGAGQVVVPVDMALRALQCRVRTGQRESRRRVIKRRIAPRGSVVTLLAGGRECSLHVARIVGVVVVVLMATYAGRIGAGQVVISIDVALRALQRGVCAGQRKAGRRVIKASIAP